MSRRALFPDNPTKTSVNPAYIAPTTQTSRCNPGKNRFSGDGTEPDHRWATLPREVRGSHSEKDEAQDERGGQSEVLGGSQGPVGEFQGEEGEKVYAASHVQPCPKPGF
jgi:hypothetical protein